MGNIEIITGSGRRLVFPEGTSERIMFDVAARDFGVDLNKDPGAQYVKNGYRVINSKRVDKSGHVPTHRIDDISSHPLYRTGMSVEEFEDAVLSRRDFGPDVHATIKDINSLDPEPARRLQNLADAAGKSGKQFSVNETRRPQDRQDFLFQQGRSRPGNIVTWTLTSDHSTGRSADVAGDMDWIENQAKEEGLDLLPIDRGHLTYTREAETEELRRRKREELELIRRKGNIVFDLLGLSK